MISVVDRKSNIPIYIAMILPIFTGVGSGMANIVAMVELIIAIYYFYSDKFWLLVPVACIYQSQLVLVGERIEFWAIYSIVCLVRLVACERTLKKSATKNKILFVLLMIYACVVMISWGEVWTGIEMFLQTVAITYAVYCVHKNDKLLLNLKRVVIFMSISAAAYGVLFTNIKGNYEEQATVVQYGARYTGTSSDPNYMAFYYCVAFCFLIFMEIKRQWIKIALMFVIFVAMALTGSLTGLATMVLIMLLYILFSKEVKLRRKVLMTILLVGVVAFFVWYIMENRTEIAILNLYRDRILEKMGYAHKGNFDDFTTGRTGLSEKYIAYLFQGNIFRILFGGYQLNAMGLLGEAAQSIRWGAHNSYVDVLMTSGIMGLICFVGAIVWKIVCNLKAWVHTKEMGKVEGIVYCIIVAFFLMGLSIFPASNYMFFIML